MAKVRYLIFQSALLTGIVSLLFLKSALGENVTITTYYPIPYAGYRNVKVKDTLTAGSSTISSATKVNGNLTINNGALTVKNTFWRVDPNTGPYGADGFRVSSATGNVAIGSNISWATTSRFKVSTVIAGQNLYALDYNSSFANKKYGQARGFTDATQPYPLSQKAQFRAMFDNGTPVNFTDDFQYAPLRVDGYYVRMGEKMADRPTFGFQGFMNNVLIGTQTPDPTVVPPDSLFLQVGNPGDGSEARGDFRIFSSREFKSDIVPFSIMQYNHALSEIGKTPVWHYHFKGDKKGQKMRIGLIAEDSPVEIVTDDKTALSLSDTFGFLAAAMKDLKSRNDALKERLDLLEKKKNELEANGKP